VQDLLWDLKELKGVTRVVLCRCRKRIMEKEPEEAAEGRNNAGGKARCIIAIVSDEGTNMSD
jgi:hypothetical protein